MKQPNMRRQGAELFAVIARLWERDLTGCGCAEQLSGRTSRIELVQGRNEPSFLPLEMRFENRRQAIDLAPGLLAVIRRQSREDLAQLTQDAGDQPMILAKLLDDAGKLGKRLGQQAERGVVFAGVVVGQRPAEGDAARRRATWP
jgi:hypothetical protein